METQIYLLLALVLFAFVMCLLYRSGIAVSKSIFAVSFLFRPLKSSDKVSVGSCTGWVRHRLRMRESGSYEFTLVPQQTAGNMQVFLLDGNKQKLLSLNPHLTSGIISLDGNARYYLRWEFTNSAGKFDLNWQKIFG